MSVGVESLFTSALGLQLPWMVEDVKLDTAKRRIDFEIGCQGSALTCPACSAGAQPVHDRLLRSWRHLDFFQFEAWLHCDGTYSAPTPAPQERMVMGLECQGELRLVS